MVFVQNTKKNVDVVVCAQQVYIIYESQEILVFSNNSNRYACYKEEISRIHVNCVACPVAPQVIIRVEISNKNIVVVFRVFFVRVKHRNPIEYKHK